MDSKPKLEYKDFIAEFNESVENNLQRYAHYSKIYDQIAESWGYISPKRCAEVCMSELKENFKDSSILDIASGTGLVACDLRKAGFLGNIDGIDASKEMVDACTYAKEYREIKVEMVKKDRPLPYDDNSYNAAICAGSLHEGHIPYESFKDMIRILKPGGLLLLNASVLRNDPGSVLINSVVHTMNELIKEGKCAFVKEELVQPIETDHPLYGYSKRSTVFCYKKL